MPCVLTPILADLPKLEHCYSGRFPVFLPLPHRLFLQVGLHQQQRMSELFRVDTLPGNAPRDHPTALAAHRPPPRPDRTKINSAEAVPPLSGLCCLRLASSALAATWQRADEGAEFFDESKP